ncbi:MAG: hypothetical protein QW057_01415 [Candidatus Bathyarchaeia archaeon]
MRRRWKTRRGYLKACLAVDARDEADTCHGRDERGERWREASAPPRGLRPQAEAGW